MKSASLRMAGPYLRNGTFYFMKNVPRRLQSVVGCKQVWVSLRTKDAREANEANIQVGARVAREWAELVARPDLAALTPIAIDTRTQVAWAGEMYADLVKRNENEPGEPGSWRGHLQRLQPALRAAERDPSLPMPIFQPYLGGIGGDALWAIGEEVQEFLAAKGVRLTEPCRRSFAMHAASAMAQGYRVLERRTLGDFEPDPRAARFPKAAPTITWQELLELYINERKPKDSSLKRIRGVLGAFFEFLGHDLPGLVTEQDAICWKQKRLQEVAVQTVRDADVAHPRALFRFALTEKVLPSNPFADVHVVIKGDKRYTRDGKVKNTRDREYTEEEAHRILAASLRPNESRESEEIKAAKRWMPWLLAYSGARVNELSQLRAEDIFQVPSRRGDRLIWMIHITPEAGRVKDDKERDVALHPHVIEQGFLDYVRSRKGRCLFYEPERARGGAVAHPQFTKVGEKLARWVRGTVGITDRRISPNHAWRHLVRSQLLAAKIQEQVINRIDGHKAANVGQKYGSVWPEVCLRAISRIPPYKDGVAVRPERRLSDADA